jgi:hypothetical protein
MLAFFLCAASTAIIAAERTSTSAYHKHYSFKKDSFTDKISAWTKILHEFKGKAGVHYLEIGTYEGRSALWILENILTHPTAKLTIIDAFQENTQKTFMSNVKLSGEAGKFTVLAGLSVEKIRAVPFNSVDFAYIDGSGKGIVMLTDLVNTWNLVKVGGVIICSRYSMTRPLRRALGLRPEDPGPHEAIDTFLTMYGPYVSVLALKGNYVAMRKKRA